jgi:hypothetical protein
MAMTQLSAKDQMAQMADMASSDEHWDLGHGLDNPRLYLKKHLLQKTNTRNLN